MVASHPSFTLSVSERGINGRLRYYLMQDANSQRFCSRIESDRRRRPLDERDEHEVLIIGTEIRRLSAGEEVSENSEIGAWQPVLTVPGPNGTRIALHGQVNTSPYTYLTLTKGKISMCVSVDLVPFFRISETFFCNAHANAATTWLPRAMRAPRRHSKIHTPSERIVRFLFFLANIANARNYRLRLETHQASGT